MFADKTKVHTLYVLIDSFLILFSLAFPYLLRYRLFSSSPGANFPFIKEYLIIDVLWALALLFFLKHYGLFRTDRTLNIPSEAFLLFRCIVISSLLIAGIIFFLKIKVFSRWVYAFSSVNLFLSLSIWRAVKRLYVRHLIEKGHNLTNVLIVGADRMTLSLYERLEKMRHLGFRVAGILTDKIQGFGPLRYLGGISEFEDIVKRYFIDEVFLSFDIGRDRLVSIIRKARNLKKGVHIVAPDFGGMAGGVKPDAVVRVPVFSYYTKREHRANLIHKRLFDVVFSLIVFFLLSPLFLIIGLVIKLTSPGPVFYIQDRVGRKGKIFKMYKFRSMVKGAHALKSNLYGLNEMKGGIMFKMKNDPRVTRIGRLLRRYSLDELPQILNVIKGDMSLVGPRPPLPEEFKAYDPDFMKRMEIRPGITGLSQVRVRRDLNFHKWMRLDRWYIENWSFALDLKIIWWTLFELFKPHAY